MCIEISVFPTIFISNSMGYWIITVAYQIFISNSMWVGTRSHRSPRPLRVGWSAGVAARRGEVERVHQIPWEIRLRIYARKNFLFCIYILCVVCVCTFIYLYKNMIIHIMYNIQLYCIVKHTKTNKIHQICNFLCVFQIK